VVAFTLFFAVSTLNRHGASVDEFGTSIAGILGIARIVAFLFLIDYAARLMRPVSVVAQIGDEGTDHRRHRAEGALAGDQRSDDGCSRARPSSAPAANRE